MDQGTQNDAQEAPLTAGIALGKIYIPFIVEHGQFVIVMLGDHLEIDGLKEKGIVSSDATDVKLINPPSPCSSRWPCQGLRKAPRGTWPRLS